MHVEVPQEQAYLVSVAWITTGLDGDI
jgi:hypothetical protein